MRLDGLALAGWFKTGVDCGYEQDRKIETTNAAYRLNCFIYQCQYDKLCYQYQRDNCFQYLSTKLKG